MVLPKGSLPEQHSLITGPRLHQASRWPFLSFPSTLGKQMAGCLQAAYWYLEEDSALIGLLAKSLLGPASGKAVTLTHHASNEMGVGFCETQIM